MIRQGFISNSSSSSFIILKDRLSSTQISMIKNHIEVYKTLQLESYENVDWTDAWTIEEKKDFILGDVSMDSFPMYEFLKDVIQIEMEYVHWIGYEPFDLSNINELIEQDKKTTLKLRRNKLKNLKKSN